MNSASSYYFTVMAHMFDDCVQHTVHKLSITAKSKMHHTAHVTV